MKAKIALIIGGLGFLGFVVFVPVKEATVTPLWRVRFKDESHKPLAGLRVNQEWIDYTYEFWRPAMHSEILVSDQDGEVVFPERVISISILPDLLARIRKFFTLNPHANSGPFSTVRCDGEKFFCYEAYSNSDPVPLTVRVLR